MSDKKLVIHAPTPAALKRAQANLRNLLAQRAALEVELVVNGPAMADAIHIDDDTVRPRLVLCANSLKGQELTAPEGVRVVPAAVAHLFDRQAQGWAYIRA